MSIYEKLPGGAVDADLRCCICKGRCGTTISGVGPCCQWDRPRPSAKAMELADRGRGHTALCFHAKDSPGRCWPECLVEGIAFEIDEFARLSAYRVTAGAREAMRALILAPASHNVDLDRLLEERIRAQP